MRDGEGTIPGAGRELARLNQLADVMRAQLLQLEHDLVVAHRDADGSHAALLLEANTLLVEAALLAQTEAATALKSLEALALASQHDALTGLPNRSCLMERMDSAIVRARCDLKSLAVLFFHVDCPREVNDMRGQLAGDEALQWVALRLQAMAGESDTVSRYGDNEFVALLPDSSGAEDAVAVVEAMMAALVVPAPTGETSRELVASAGVVVFPQHGEDSATLIQRAKAAMYVARRSGFGQYALHGVDGRAQGDAKPRTDASALQASEENLREANTQLVVAALQAQAHEAEAREDHRRQIQYMAKVAHELRNPLVPIRMAAGLLNLQGPGGSPSLPRLQTIIERQVVQIARLVEDLLEGSRISTGKLRLERVDVDMIEILEHAVLTCRAAMDARGQTLAVSLGLEALPMQGDPVRLAQVFCNLLDNASKYTPSGGEITLSASRSGDLLTVTVSDNGVGISPLAITRIFDLFVQDDHAMVLDSRGLGIGLAVVRELVDSHGGSVSAHSEGKDKGSEFVVTLPMTQ